MKNWLEFKDAEIALAGAGKENLALLPYLTASGARVDVLEQEATDELKSQVAKYKNVELITGEDYLSNLTKYSYIFRTPGMSAWVLKKAVDDQFSHAHITSAIDLFLAKCPGKTIGITGTKGKGTTASMLDAMLEKAKIKHCFVGNIGKPVFELFESIDAETVAIMELSSFQLEDVEHSPKIAVILPITQDHLEPLNERSPNYHRSIGEYVEAKTRIIKFQTEEDKLFYSFENQTVSEIASKALAKKYYLSNKENDENNLLEDGRLTILGQSIADMSLYPWHGKHFRLDGALAAMVAIDLGVKNEAIDEALKDYKSLPHRLEIVAEKKGVIYVDDSYATNPISATAALESFSKPVIWIVGGLSKGAIFADLAKAAAGSTVKLAVVIGEESATLIESLNHYAQNIKIENAGDDFAKAFSIAVENSVEGDVILLSPACASTDMFKNADERGQIYRKLVDELHS